MGVVNPFTNIPPNYWGLEHQTILYIPTTDLDKCISLVYRGRVTHICKLDENWCRWCILEFSVPGHFLTHCWLIVKWLLRSELLWNVNQSTTILVHDIDKENIVRIMAFVSSQPQKLIQFSKKFSVCDNFIEKLITMYRTANGDLRCSQLFSDVVYNVLVNLSPTN